MRRLRAQPLLAEPLLLAGMLLATAAAAGAAPAPHPASARSPILVAYSFDDELVETGPDTFTVFANARGSVRLTGAYRTSGSSSVEIRDRSGDGAFPELQGRFPLRRHGILFLHFALMTADPRQELNIALAGPQWFQLGKDGIAFWLSTHDGWLLHTSDSIPKKLLAIEPFTWYAVDVEYDIDHGRYDLAITREGERAPLLALTGQPNAASQPGSAVDTFSFAGDVRTDRSDVVYYVDDVVVASDREAVPHGFFAPGRRLSFVELFEHYRAGHQRLACPPAQEPADFGLDPVALQAQGQLEAVQRALRGELAGDQAGEGTALGAILSWQDGCRELAARRPKEALERFDRAALAAPGPIVALSRALALAGSGRGADASTVLTGLPVTAVADPRYGLTLALLGAQLPTLHEGLAADLAAEARFYLLMLRGERGGAAELADEQATAAQREDRSPARWLELRGDAAFLDGDFDTAKRRYEASLGAAPEQRLLLKLADVAWKQGDRARERALRETIYGSLVTPKPSPSPGPG